MRQQYNISQYCSIKNERIILNNETVFSSQTKDFATFMKQAYTNVKLTYPKFFKMDNLSKLAFLTADLILKNRAPSATDTNTALVFSNRASSLETDRAHQKTIANRAESYPSPAVFVYTLPNICLGEISIKHKLYSENNFFIFERFNPKYLVAYTTALLDENETDSVLCGWVDVDEDSYEAILYLVERHGQRPFNEEELTRLYHT